MIMRYAGIEYDDVANGTGLGAVFFVQGCPHHCKGCHNPQTWDPNGGLEFTENVLDELFTYFREVPFAKRLTISGGDPIANHELTYYVLSRFVREFPDHQVWLYTGYSCEYVFKHHMYIASLCDVIVDGEFIESLRDITLQFKGSSNQNIIDVKKSLETGKKVILT